MLIHVADRSFWLILSGFVFVLATIFSADLDLRIADWLYQQEGGYLWTLKDNLTIKAIYKLQKWAVTGTGVFLIGLLILSYFAKDLKPFKYPLMYVVITIIVGLLVVNLLKKTTHLPCPYDIKRYLGYAEYASFLDLFKPGAQHEGRCFPAGHASGGYVYICFYYFFCVVKPKYRYAALAVGLSLGLSFGVIQQLRGAHFISHDVFTLSIVWLVSHSLFRFFINRSLMTDKSKRSSAHVREPILRRSI